MSLNLKKALLFSGMDDRTVSFFASRGHRRSCRKGEDLFAMGDLASSFFFVESGWIKLYRTNHDGAESIVHIFGRGETFAEAAMFGSVQRYPVNAQGAEDSELFEIPRHVLMEKIREDSEVALSILNVTSARHHHLIQQIENLTVMEAPQRLGYFFLRLCPSGKKTGIKVDLPYDKTLIAHYLHIQPETFSRALKKLEPYGVTAEGKTVTIGDASLLMKFCDMDEQSGLP